MILALISFAIPSLAGFFLVDALFKKQAEDFFGALFKICLAVGAGFGMSSALFFIWLAALGSCPGARFISFAALEFVFLIILWAAWRPVTKNTSRPLSTRREQRAKFDIISFVFCGILILSIADIVILSVANPHGGWDAWVIWNLRARFIFRAGQYWTGAFSAHLNWSHTDYPLAIPLFVARCWKYISCESVVMPILTAGFFFTAIIGVITASLSMLYGRQRAGLAGLVLLGTPFFITHSASQYADIPLAFYMLAALILLRMHEKGQDNSGLIFLAGLLSGMAAWTKNEGQLFLAAVIIGQFFAVVPTSGWRPFFGRMAVFFKGCLPMLLILAYFKLKLAPPGDLFAADRTLSALTGRIADLQRWQFIAGEFYRSVIGFGMWPVFFLPALILAGALFGVKINPLDKPAIIGSAVPLAVMLLGYYFIFLITPHDIKWHISTSLDRLLLQMWPSAVFLFVQLVKFPERAV